MLIVAGCDPLIRGYNLETGAVKLFHGHKGWVYCLMIYKEYLYSGGDDNVVRIWNCDTGDQIEQLIGHRNGVTQITVANNQIYTGSFDHYILQWDVEELTKRIEEKKQMKEEDILSRKIETFNRYLADRKKKK